MIVAGARAGLQPLDRELLVSASLGTIDVFVGA
jgi:hypothetical protein